MPPCDDGSVTPGDRLEALERRYLVARDARDRLDVARARAEPADQAALEDLALAASTEVHARYDAFDPTDAAALGDDDRRAFELIGSGMDAADDYRLPVAPDIESEACDNAAAWRDAMARGGDALRSRLEACYAVRAAGLTVGTERVGRLGIIDRLRREPDRGRRQALFLALEPLWRVMAGDDEARSPYRALIRESAPGWRAGGSSTARNAEALGTTRDAVET